MRSTALVLPVAVLAGLVAMRGPDARSGSRTSMDCAGCHPTITREWRDSAHGRAFVDPIWRKELARTAAPERCVGRHAPSPVAARLGHMPAPREADRDSGVDCAACHLQRGVVHGPLGCDVADHATDPDPLFGEASSVHLCASCHDTRIGPVLPLARDFRASSHARNGRGCVRCHMPHEERTVAVDPDSGKAVGARREGRSHAILGPADADFAASAFDVALRSEGARLLLTVRNLAGHRVPGLLGRSFEFVVEQRDGARTLTKDTVRLSADNLLLVDETREFRIAKTPGAGSAVLHLLHTLHGASSTLSEREFTW